MCVISLSLPARLDSEFFLAVCLSLLLSRALHKSFAHEKQRVSRSNNDKDTVGGLIGGPLCRSMRTRSWCMSDTSGHCEPINQHLLTGWHRQH